MRALTILFAIGFIIAALFGGMAATYGLAGLVAGAFPGAANLTNLLLLMLVFVMVIATLLTLAERKWSALMQDRIGPNVARINLPGIKNRSLAGIPHVVADVVKMLTKEDFLPALANPFMYFLGPVLAFAPAFALFAVVPAGPTLQVMGNTVEMIVTNPDFGLLYVFAIASLAVYGTALAGWSSNNKFALLGGVRASSQMISYEVALGLSLVGIMMTFSTVRLGTDVFTGALGITDAQAQYLWKLGGGGFDFGLPAWGIFLQPLGFILFFTASFAETKRAPFDVPEGESEIIGYFVEYSGMKFGMFMISEFVEVVVLAGLSVAIFFGGYHLPFGGEWLKATLQGWPIVYGAILGTVFWVKVILLIYLQLAIRWTFPRFRYDQIQTLGWKILLPIGLANVFVTGALLLWDPTMKALAIGGLIQIATLVFLTVSPRQPSSHGHSALATHGAHH